MCVCVFVCICVCVCMYVYACRLCMYALSTCICRMERRSVSSLRCCRRRRRCNHQNRKAPRRGARVSLTNDEGRPHGRARVLRVLRQRNRGDRPGDPRATGRGGADPVCTLWLVERGDQPQHGEEEEQRAVVAMAELQATPLMTPRTASARAPCTRATASQSRSTSRTSRRGRTQGRTQRTRDTHSYSQRLAGQFSLIA